MKAMAWWGKRLAGLGLMGLLGACELAVSADLGEVECPADSEGLGYPFCPTNNVCQQGKCVPCEGGSCLASGASGEGGAAGASGGDGAGQSGEAGHAGKPAGGAGQGGTAGSGAAGASSASGAGTGGAGAGGSAGQGGAGQAGAGASGSNQGGTSGGGQGGAGSGQGGNAGQGGAGAGGAGMAGMGGAPFMTTGELGAPCQQKSDCTAKNSTALCQSQASLGLAGEGSICIKTCCKSDECGAPDQGAVCWPSPGGISVCVAGDSIGRTKVGAVGIAQTCDQASPDESKWCRSGICQDGKCLDTCCTDSTCQANDSSWGCTLVDIPGDTHAGYLCQQQNKTDAGYLTATGCNEGVQSNTCRSRSCDANKIDDKANLVTLCSQSCCTSASCGDYESLIPFTTVFVTCDYVASDTKSGSTLRECSPRMSFLTGTPPFTAAPAATGEGCGMDGECRSNHCKDGYCTDACCTDSNCPTDMRCLPNNEGGALVLRCLK